MPQREGGNPARSDRVHPLRARFKRALTPLAMGRACGVTVLIYHRVGGGTADERDCPVAAFAAQMAELATHHHVVSLDEALDGLARGDRGPRVVLTFDDGFADLYATAWPILRAHALPFTVYLATAYLGGSMHWEGSTAAEPGAALTWPQVTELAADPLCTVGNHTHTHPRPEALTAEELDACTHAVRVYLGVKPRHFTYTWGVPVTGMEPELRARFRSTTTGEVGRNRPGVDFHRLRRVPVRASDPFGFFQAKIAGSLLAERVYDGVVTAAKAAGARG